jgi:hypothetical protein
MNRIYQGRVSKVEIQNILSASIGFLRSREREKVAKPDEGCPGKAIQWERNKGEVSNQNPWQPLGYRLSHIGHSAKPLHHELFQDAVNSFPCQSHA